MEDWSDLEVDLIIDDYFQMLNEEIKGRPYNKTTHRNRLLPLLKNRNSGSIEFKHQNISAILVKSGLPYITGYKPRGNYQKLLADKVLAYLMRNTTIDRVFDDFATQEIPAFSNKILYDKWLTDPPAQNQSFLSEPEEQYYLPKKQNYLELEQRNASIGFVGEELVFEYEKWRLDKSGYPKLAKEVKWVSKEQGDGAGYDILSKDIVGSDIFIEVKTTTLGKDTPIFFSKRENDFSNDHKKSFNLYRVFDVKRQPKMFNLKGSFREICSIEPINFKGTF